MADLSQLPMEELMRLREQMAPAPAQAPAEAPAAMPDLGSMPIEQLMALRDQARQAQPAPAGGEQPWYSKLGGAADDMARIIANGATLGAADKFAGYMGGKGETVERGLTNEARDRAGSAAIAGDVIGALGPGTVAAKGGAALVGAVAPKVAAGAGILGRTAGMGVVGAGLGAGEAAIKDEDIGKGALIGGLAGAGGNLAGEAISAGVGKIAGAFNKPPKIPTNPELRAAADKAYKAADDAGVIFTPQGVQRAGTTIQSELADLGFLPANQPRVAAVLGELEKASANNNTLKGLDQVRRMAGGAFDPTNPASNKMLAKVVKGIDDLVENPGAGEVIAQDAKAGATAIKEARDYWSRLRKSEALGEAVAKAERRAASTGSGGNSDNAIRQNVRGILDSKSKSRGYSADEMAAAEAVVRGSAGQNMARLAGKLSPVGNGLMAALGIAGTAANPMLAAVPAIGGAAKYIADKATPNKVEMLSKIIRAGGDKSAAVAPPNAVQRLAESKRDALARLLMTGGMVAARQ